MTLQKPLIALDADGVLLDYHQAYRLAWLQAFGEDLQEVNPNAYSPSDRWGARRLQSREELAILHEAMREAFWSDMQAIDGALKACNALHDAGFELVCVTALANKYETHRMENLKRLGFPIERVHATGSDWAAAESISPKAKILNQLKPVAFVDDFAPYLRGVSDSIHKAIIMGGIDSSPNVGEDLLLANSQHQDLLNFSLDWLSR